MSSGVTSGLAHGTTGSPQTQMENFEYASKLAQLQAETENGKFTASQKSTLLSVSNTISDHLTEKDYSGVVRDLADDPIPKGNTGKNWDHNDLFEPYGGIEKWKKK